MSDLALLLLQLMVIMIAVSAFRWLAHRLNQPSVIGEITAGIILGPSVLGAVFSKASGFVFPQHSFGNLTMLSQVGLLLFMFIVGLELNVSMGGRKLQHVIAISNCSIAVPFLLGVGLAAVICPVFAPDGVPFLVFSLFMGISLSITAFPVLARIIRDKGLSHTEMGTLALMCASVGDFTAWCLLAVIVAVAGSGSFSGALVTVLLSLAYVAVMQYVLRPYLQNSKTLNRLAERSSRHTFTAALAFMLLSALTAEALGIHALFGAFLAGSVLPKKDIYIKGIAEKLEELCLAVLLPIFFVLTGLKTHLGALLDPPVILLTAAVVVLAVAGKLAGTAAAARLSGLSWKESLSIGILMNTRGLMELIVLNIGYDLGILSQTMFTAMVLMALITTWMTGPALNLVERLFPLHEEAVFAKSSDPAPIRPLNIRR